MNPYRRFDFLAGVILGYLGAVVVGEIGFAILRRQLVAEAERFKRDVLGR